MKYFVALLSLLLVVPAIACTKVNPNLLVSLNQYYSGVSNNTNGAALKSQLNQIIDNHQNQSYSCVWSILREADEDIANTNNVIGFYSRRSIPKSMQDNGSNGNDAWNREHIWARSHGFRSSGQHAHNDAHHLRATDKSVNAARGNKDFDFGGAPQGECSNCRTDSDSWQPPSDLMGDVARMMFYMAVRYEGNDNTGTPDLELVSRTTSTGETVHGWLDTMLEWNNLDPVSEEERLRNDIIYEWQGNRNPFIDHPEYVSRIWGGAPPPPPISWDYTATGTLRTGETDFHPDGNYYFVDRSGLFEAELSFASGLKFDLQLYRWNGSAWVKVAESLFDDPLETINYNGTAGYYYWAVRSFRGDGSYTFSFNSP